MLFLGTCAAAFSFAKAPDPNDEASKPVSKRFWPPGTILAFAEPFYPAEALAKGESATVQVQGVVDARGALRDLQLASDPPHPEFEAEVRGAAVHWTFLPAYAPRTCEPREAQVEFSVAFEVVDGKPRISRSETRSIAPRVHWVTTKEGGDRTPVHQVHPTYPRSLMTEKSPAQVFQLAFLAVVPDGTVTSVTLAPMPRRGHFEASLPTALKRWRFREFDEPWCGFVEIQFRLKD